jgi:hypothetical protein
MPRSDTESGEFVWKDFGRFVEVAAVELGWLVLWGVYHDMGRRRELLGNRTYRDLIGARRRVADVVIELNGDASLVAEAMVRFDRTPFPQRAPIIIAQPL